VALAKCKTCGYDLSSNAAICSSCGQRSRISVKAVLVVAAGLLLAMVVGFSITAALLTRALQ
jgi:uncharacterized OB-fold protein